MFSFYCPFAAFKFSKANSGLCLAMQSFNLLWRLGNNYIRKSRSLIFIHRCCKKLKDFMKRRLGYPILVLILAVGGGYLIQQELSLGDLTALLSFAALLAMPFISLGMVLSAWQTGIVSLESMRKILDRPTHAQDQIHLPLARREQLFSHHIRVRNWKILLTELNQ